MKEKKAKSPAFVLDQDMQKRITQANIDLKADCEQKLKWPFQTRGTGAPEPKRSDPVGAFW